MNEINKSSLPPKNSKIKAVGLMSGGLDSTLAAKIIKDQGIEVYGMYCIQPWEDGYPKPVSKRSAEAIGINFVPIVLDETYIDMLRNPKYGYGSAFNPCKDCHIHFFKLARQFMDEIGADFVFTGEVLGQRPMSQVKDALRVVEKGSGLEGLLLRPLSAKLLDATIPEERGWIDIEKMFDISGRSRKEQIKLAKNFGITEYPAPAGGCLLTDRNYGKRFKDALDFGYRDFNDFVSLKWGRIFRLNDQFKVLIGRNVDENEELLKYAHEDDHIMSLKEKAGPVIVLKGKNPSNEILEKAASLVARFSKFRAQNGLNVQYWKSQIPKNIQEISSKILPEEEIRKMKI